MRRGRHWYPKIKVICQCGWSGKRTTFMSRKPCPRCSHIPKERGKDEKRNINNRKCGSQLSAPVYKEAESRLWVGAFYYSVQD
jgi:hypothetical protein